MEENSEIKIWTDEYGYGGKLQLVEKLRDIPLTDEQICEVLNVIGGVCKHCWNADGRCCCWNDE